VVEGRGRGGHWFWGIPGAVAGRARAHMCQRGAVARRCGKKKAEGKMRTQRIWRSIRRRHKTILVLGLVLGRQAMGRGAHEE